MSEGLLIAILAAGASRRLGQPKQLVMLGGKPLLRRQCEVAVEAGIGPVVVIVGCQADACRGAITSRRVSIHLNDHWSTGIGSSIACAARAALDADASGLLIFHCDQFAITAFDLRVLSNVWNGDRSKAVRSRAGTYVGPPVIFPASSFVDLMRLSGDDGAKSVIATLGQANVLEAEIPSAAEDLDTSEQLVRLR